MDYKIDDILKNIKGLSDKEVILSREKNGANKLNKSSKKPLILKIISIFKEPMFLLLIIAASVYFIVGSYIDGIIMLVFVIAVSFIEFIQEVKTDKALEELNKLSSLNIKVIRNNKKEIVSSDEIVVGDIVILEEGDKVPADGMVLYSQSLGVNESSLTGESEIVYKSANNYNNKNHFKLNMCYSSTDVTNGMGVIKIVSVGSETEIGIVGESLKNIKKEKSLLEKQIGKLVFACTILSCVIFILTMIITYINYSELIFSKRIVESLLSGITIAMATIPEEIPVILTVFLAMGAWQLTKEKALTKDTKVIENLGYVDVLCTDKTGTLTKNKMEVQSVYSFSKTFIETLYYACPLVVYDPMEVAIKKYCDEKNKANLKYKITKEYTFTQETKMMGLIWDNETLCVKGAYESILPLCNLNKNDYDLIKEKIDEYAKEGFRILAVARKNNLKTIPNSLLNLKLSFEGLVALYDPPRDGVKLSLNKCYHAGIRVIMITGDNGQTAKGIAKKIELKNYEEVITGNELENMSDKELEEKVKTVNIFARVYPNHKMRIVNALQKNKKVVAMTGDGVNDAPALKKANVGIAMGQRGTNVAKESADLILLDDNFNTIVKAIENGRNIYMNIRKAISYVIAIHIPIALLSLFVPLFKLPTLLFPIHVMLLELLIDPTSSIIFQRIKPSKNIMNSKPRNIDESILNRRNIIKSILQGLLIFIIVFATYTCLIKNNVELKLSITTTYSILVLSIMLISYQLKNDKSTLKNFIDSFNDKVVFAVNFVIIILLGLYIYLPFFNNVANTNPLNLKQWLYVIISTLLAVLPFDLLKIKKYFNNKNTK